MLHGTNLQDWLKENQPGTNMNHSEDFWEAYIFWRDVIIPMFTYVKKDDGDTMVSYVPLNLLDPSTVVGFHVSKSVLSPVLKIDYKNVEIVFRYNFYDYEIAIISNAMPLDFPISGLFQSKKEIFFYQGFPDKYILPDRYEDNHFKFMAKVPNHYQFYTFMALLKYTIDRGPMCFMEN